MTLTMVQYIAVILTRLLEVHLVWSLFILGHGLRDGRGNHPYSGGSNSRSSRACRWKQDEICAKYIYSLCLSYFNCTTYLE
jgi:hypothetical protein